MNPSNVEIRQFILDTFSENDFVDLFCSDYFPQAKNDFSADMSFTRMAQRLIEYCQHRDVVDNLLVDLQKERPVAYARRFGSVTPHPEAVVQTSQTPVRNPAQIFISHAHQDVEFAHRLAMDLRQRGWLVWITPESILPGEKWVAAIGRGLDESGVFLALLTPAAVASEWVKSESDSAIDLEHEHQIRLIPLLVQPCPVPTMLRGYQRVSFIADYSKGLAQLIAALEPPRPIVPEESVEPPSWHEAIVPTKDKDLPPKAQHEAGVRPGAARKVHEEQARSGADDLEHGAPDTVAHQGQKESHNPVSVPDQTVPHVREEQERSVEARWIAEPVKAVEAGQPGQPTGAYLPARSTQTRKIPRRGLFAAVIALVVLSASAVLFAARLGSTNTPTPRPLATGVYQPQAVVTNSLNEVAFTLAPGVTMTLVRVPAGEFLMGSDPAKDKDAPKDEQPQHQVYVSEFYIGKYEVTNAQYRAFAEATGRSWEMPAGKQAYPAVNVTWDEAVAFGQWVGQVTGRKVHLPTEAEWEKACRGTDGRVYPWGNEWDPGKLNSQEGGAKDTTPVGKYSPAGDSPYGAADMAGNAWEWTADWYGEDEYKEHTQTCQITPKVHRPFAAKVQRRRSETDEHRSGQILSST